MSKGLLRKDMTCLNCNHVVEKRFCPNCGQENCEYKKSFTYLFTHFAEDFVHYDNYFWKTVKNLLLKPGVLSKEYITGKRARYVPPIKLYIFISFMTFFSLSLLNSIQNDEQEEQLITIKSSPKTNALNFSEYKSVKEFDSINNLKPDTKKLKGIKYWANKRFVQINQKYTPEQQLELFQSSLFKNTPKAIFLYMPFFAFGLWLFQSKKKFYYFDSGVFTLHYFSFLLLTITLFYFCYQLLELINASTLNTIIGIVLALYWVYYFFKGHHFFYEEKTWVSRFKCVFLFLINLFFIIILLIVLVFYSAINIH